MAESSLSKGYPDFRLRLGRYLGLDVTVDNWSAQEVIDVDAAIDDGYDRFLGARRWSFLTTSGTVTTVASTAAYALADDFGQIDGYFNFAADSGYPPITPIGLSQYDALLASSSGTGLPTRYAMRTATFTGASTGQRTEVLFYRTPDAAYVISYRYSRYIHHLRTDTPYPLGGMDQGRAILACMIAEAAAMFRSADEAQNRSRLADVELARSWDIDLRNVPAHLGSMRDNSDNAGYTGRFDRLENPAAHCTMEGGYGDSE